MGPSQSTEQTTGLSPSEAFDIVGDQTRLQILQALGEAEEPLAFSEVFERIEYDDTGNFSYHLQTLEGHFIEKKTDGYLLLRGGERIMEAILSGAITDSSEIERTPAGRPCLICGGEMELSYRQEMVRLYCSDCGGTRNSSSDTDTRPDGDASDVIGGVGLPPAGIKNRTTEEVIAAAEIWSVSHGQSASRGVCPRCAAPLSRTVRVCENHDASEGDCDVCDQRFGVTVILECSNCIFTTESVFTSHLLGTPELMSFLIEHDIDPIKPEAAHLRAFDEEVLSTDPFEGKFTFTIEGEALTLTVDETLSVVEADQRIVSGNE